MLEVNAIYFILLIEALVLLLILLLVLVLVVLIRRRRRCRDVAQLVSSIKDGSALRGAQTKSFLETVYQFEAEDMRSALLNIEKQEAEFFQHLIDSLYRRSGAPVTTLNELLYRLIESYKCLQPRFEAKPVEEPEAVRELATMREENETLHGDLSLANNKLSAMMMEFGEIFGGGKDHQLTLKEIMDKVDAMKAAQKSEPLSAAHK